MYENTLLVDRLRRVEYMFKYRENVIGVIYSCRYRYDDKKNELMVFVNNKYYLLKNNSIDVFKLLLSPYIYNRSNLICSLSWEVVEQNLEFLFQIGIADIAGNKKLVWNKDLLLVSDKFGNGLISLFTKEFYLLKGETMNSFMSRNLQILSLEEKENLLLNNILKYETEFKQINAISDRYVYYIVLSYACNLNCTYCFQKQRVIIKGKDDINILDIIDRIILSHSEQESIILTFYGGESLLQENFTMIKKIVNKYIEKNIKFRIITNGVNLSLFKNKLFETFLKINRYIITIDGDKEIHNSRRRTMSEKGSFDRIISGIKELVKYRMNVTIRINIDKGNYQNITKVIKYIQRLDKTEKYIQIDIHPVSYNAEPTKEDSMNIHYMYNILKKIRQDNIKNVYFYDKFIQYCYYLMKNNYFYSNEIKDCFIDRVLLIDPSGKLYACNEANGIERFQKELEVGNRTPTIINYFDGCVDKCHFFKLCLGGCPLNRVNNRGFSIESCEKKKLYSTILTEIFDENLSETYGWVKKCI